MPTPAPTFSAHEVARNLGVAWMNRGHALMKQREAADLTASLDAYNEAVAILRRLPFTENPSWANSLGAALLNCGQLIHRIHGTAQATVALGVFEEAAAVLRAIVLESDSTTNPWPRRNLAGTLLNRANLLLDLGQFFAASQTAREALTLAQPLEHDDALDAELALKARRALCDALGQLLVIPGADQNQVAAEAGDLAEDALALIRRWSGSETAHFPGLAVRFFRFGARLYRFHQPHFLAEFVRENFARDTPEYLAAALDAIDGALSDRPQGSPFFTVGDTATDRHLAIARDLAVLRAQIAA